MAIEIKIDKQGRIIIPAEYRKKMNISPDTKLKISFIANQLVIRKQSKIDDESLKSWKKKLKSLNLNPNIENKIEFNEKWMSEQYARDKLGF